MGRFEAPSPFSQGGTGNLQALGFSSSYEHPRNFGPKEWSRSAAKKELRLSGQTKFMTPARFKELLETSGLSIKDIAIIFSVRTVDVRWWRSGKKDIPKTVDEFFEKLKLFFTDIS